MILENLPTDRATRHALVPHLLSLGRNDDAIAIAQANVQLAPSDPVALFGLGYASQMTGRNAEAMAAYRRAYAIDSELPSLRRNMATALHHSGGNQEEVLRLLEEAVTVNSSDSDAWSDLAYHYRRHFNIDAAVAAGQRACDLAPSNALGLMNLAAALREAGRWDEARKATRQAVAVQPENVMCRFALFSLKLLDGKYDWSDYELRWEGVSEHPMKRPDFPYPTWQGESLTGKTLFLWGEQGLGDVFQFCRYVPLLAGRVHDEGGKLVWNCFPALTSLLQRSLGQYADLCVSGAWDPAIHADYEVSLLSLPLRFNTREETIPASIPYLMPEQDSALAWRKRLSGDKRLKVGLTWTGSRNHNRNPYRSVGLARMAEHFSAMREGVAFYSLQPGEREDVAAAREAGFEISDYTDELTTYDDTAAFVDSLDLVISVCTSMVHLSGAMGKRTWALVDTNPYWVWQLGRTDSPWYPNTTLYRQQTFAQWSPVLETVARDLGNLVTSRAGTGK